MDPDRPRRGRLTLQAAKSRAARRALNRERARARGRFPPLRLTGAPAAESARTGATCWPSCLALLQPRASLQPTAVHQALSALLLSPLSRLQVTGLSLRPPDFIPSNLPAPYARSRTRTAQPSRLLGAQFLSASSFLRRQASCPTPLPPLPPSLQPLALVRRKPAISTPAPTRVASGAALWPIESPSGPRSLPTWKAGKPKKHFERSGHAPHSSPSLTSPRNRSPPRPFIGVIELWTAPWRQLPPPFTTESSSATRPRAGVGLIPRPAPQPGVHGPPETPYLPSEAAALQHPAVAHRLRACDTEIARLRYALVQAAGLESGCRINLGAGGALGGPEPGPIPAPSIASPPWSEPAGRS